MATITAIKQMVRSLEYPEEDKLFPWVIVWVMAHTDTPRSGWVGETDFERLNAERASQIEEGRGWHVVQIAVCDDQWEKVLFRVNRIETQRGEHKVYKTLDTLAKEMKAVFGRKSNIQLRGL